MYRKGELIAPCVIHCGLYSNYLAMTNDMKRMGVAISYFAGCKPRDRKHSFLKNRHYPLMNRKVGYYYKCEKFPCENLEYIGTQY